MFRLGIRIKIIDIMKKIIRYIPLTIVILLILILTTQNTQENVQLSEAIRLWCSKYIESGWWNTPGHFRKLAHIVEYFLLGLSMYPAIRKVIPSILICLSISILDQVVKIFVPIRHFDITDMPYDALGYVVGIVIVYCIFKRISTRNKY